MDQLLTASPSAGIATPVAQKQRISILDSLRGIAIMGILLMNIPYFGYPAGEDPSVYQETGINYYTWYIVSLIPQGTQRALFSMLFGAGIILFIEGKQKRLDGLMPADYFFRRQLWLMVFSVFDVFILLWVGDILLDYAVYGMMMFAFRNWSPKKLLIAAGFCFLFMMARENAVFYHDKVVIAKGEKIAAIDTTKTRLTPLQNDDLAAMQDFKQRTSHEGKVKRADKLVLKLTDNYSRLYETRTTRYLNSLVEYIYLSLWDVLVFMFIGMAFYRSGILLGRASVKLYSWMTIIGLGLGIFLTWLNLRTQIHYNFNWFELTKGEHIQYYELTRILRALGILGFIMLLYKSGWFKWLFWLFRPAGQMAFTNYLSQSLICGLIFYGVGLAMFGKLLRYEIYLVVAGVWTFQIIFSHIWLHYFYFGPLEWLWRSLTYWRKQPMRKPDSNSSL